MLDVSRRNVWSSDLDGVDSDEIEALRWWIVPSKSASSTRPDGEILNRAGSQDTTVVPLSSASYLSAVEQSEAKMSLLEYTI